MGKSNHVCPWWLGPLLCCPARRLFEAPPEAIVAPYIKSGMTVLEPGAGMGWFTLPMARMVGANGRIICPDLQPRMVSGLQRRARRAGLADRIEAFTCTVDDLGIAAWNGRIDTAFAIHMLHEVANPRALLAQLAAAVRPGGTFFVLEPKGHVPAADFDRMVAETESAGFRLRVKDRVKRGLRAVFERT